MKYGTWDYHGQLHRHGLNALLRVGKVESLVEPGLDEGQEDPVDGRRGDGDGLVGLDDTRWATFEFGAAFHVPKCSSQ